MRLTYSAYTPPPPKKKKKFARARFRGKTAAAPDHPGCYPRCAGKVPRARRQGRGHTGCGRDCARAAKPATTQQASNNDQKMQKPGKPEKIRFGQAPRESLPPSQVATAAAPDNTPGVTTPENPLRKPGRTVSGAATAAKGKEDPPEQPAAREKSENRQDYCGYIRISRPPKNWRHRRFRTRRWGWPTRQRRKRPKRRPKRPAIPPSRSSRTKPRSLIWANRRPPQAAPAASQPPVPGAPASEPRGAQQP